MSRQQNRVDRAIVWFIAVCILIAGAVSVAAIFGGSK